nr:hypothetical protein [Chenggangzhangella methanolivorans]
MDAHDLVPRMGLGEFRGGVLGDAGLAAEQKDPEVVPALAQQRRREVGAVEVFIEPAAVEEPRADVDPDAVVEDQERVERAGVLGRGHRLQHGVGVRERHADLARSFERPVDRRDRPGSGDVRYLKAPDAQELLRHAPFGSVIGGSLRSHVPAPPE